MSPIVVSTTQAELARKLALQSAGTPTHWADPQHSAFINPWPSFRNHGLRQLFSALYATLCQRPKIPDSLDSLLPVRTPTWRPASADTDANSKLKATWLGHACFLVELPARALPSQPPPSRGPRILFDPVFSDRCSPSQLIGPMRYTKPPCKMEDIPDIDAIVISHNHYDHMDTTTLRNLSQRARPPHIFAPLGNAPYFRAIGVPASHVHTLDWWESRRVAVDIPTATATASAPATTQATFDLTCTPAQHFTGRGVFDRCKTLWASWVVAEVPADATTATADHPDTADAAKVFFGGDTAYRTVHDGEDEDAVPVCPAFAEIGRRFGGFDLALLPIGAYLPRDFMSAIHCAPQDSVRLFQDIRAKRALGMHWGAWVLTTEDVLEPPRRLREACAKAGIGEGVFGVCEIGETVGF